MSLKIIVLVGYAIFLLVGAFFGLKAGSKVSLYMGLASSLVVLLGLFVYKQNQNLGNIILTVLTCSLTALFLFRLIKTGKMMPSGMLMVMSALALLAVLFTK